MENEQPPIKLLGDDGATVRTWRLHCVCYIGLRMNLSANNSAGERHSAVHDLRRGLAYGTALESTFRLFPALLYY